MDNEFNIGDVVLYNKTMKSTIIQTIRLETDNNYWWQYKLENGYHAEEHEIELYQEEKDNYKLKFEKMEALNQELKDQLDQVCTEQRNTRNNTSIYTAQIINERDALRNRVEELTKENFDLHSDNIFLEQRLNQYVEGNQQQYETISKIKELLE